nr:immunoglobulin heavy chain junction region [Macaca mulatta]
CARVGSATSLPFDSW